MYPDTQPQQSTGSKLLLVALIIGGITVLSCMACFGGLVLVGDRGGARAAYEMEGYAQEYVDENGLLQQGESLVMYFDVTMATDGTNAYIITDRRVLHHTPNGDLSIPLTEVVEVGSHDSGMGTWTYTAIASSGDSVMMEIPAFNGIAKFGRGLDKALNDAGNPIDFEIPRKE